jgi:hypothetical protein
MYEMAEKSLISIIETPTHPKLSSLYQSLGIREFKVSSMRKAMSVLKKEQPDFIVAEFFYGYGNNYAGVNLSNLDVLLSSFPKYSTGTRAIVFVQKHELEYVKKLNELYPVYAAFLHATPHQAIKDVLEQ